MRVPKVIFAACFAAALLASDEWKLSGIDSGGAEYELSIDRDDWDRLEKIGTPYDESWDVYRLELGENVRLVGHWLPGSDKLIDWEIEQELYL